MADAGTWSVVYIVFERVYFMPAENQPWLLPIDRKKLPLRRGVGAAWPPAGSEADGRGLPSYGRAAASLCCAKKNKNRDFTGLYVPFKFLTESDENL